MEKKGKKRLTAEKVAKILEKHGTKVNPEEAKIILDFMERLAHIAVNQYIYNSTKDC